MTFDIETAFVVLFLSFGYANKKDREIKYREKEKKKERGGIKENNTQNWPNIVPSARGVREAEIGNEKVKVVGRRGRETREGGRDEREI